MKKYPSQSKYHSAPFGATNLDNERRMKTQNEHLLFRHATILSDYSVDESTVMSVEMLDCIYHFIYRFFHLFNIFHKSNRKLIYHLSYFFIVFLRETK